MFAQIKDGVVVKYPIPSLQALFPETSLPAELVDSNLPEGYVRVYTSAPPEVSFLQVAEPGLPVFTQDHRWVMGWTVRALNPEEIQRKIEQLEASYDTRIEDRLNSFARSRRYKDIVSLCSYAGSAHTQRAAEARCGLDLRDATYDACYEMLAEVKAGAPVPSWAQVQARLPALEWPAEDPQG